MFHVYALTSTYRNYIYVGLTSDLARRVAQHNDGKERTTRPYRPFKLILAETYETREQARKREVFLKAGSGKEYLKTISSGVAKGEKKS